MSNKNNEALAAMLTAIIIFIIFSWMYLDYSACVNSGGTHVRGTFWFECIDAKQSEEE